MKILDVCKSHGIHVRESGDGDYWGECPLCNSDGPQLLIDARANTYRCYACKRQGTAAGLDRRIQLTRVR